MRASKLLATAAVAMIAIGTLLTAACVYAPPQTAWAPAHYEGPYFVPGHCA